MAACISPFAVLPQRLAVKCPTTTGRSFLSGETRLRPSAGCRMPQTRKVSVVRSALAADPSEVAPYFKPEGWKKVGVVGQATAIGTVVAGFGAVMDHDLPAPMRLALLTYFLATSAEWGFHKFDMHQTDVGHIFHHNETNQDMSMPEGFDINAIQFPRSASIKIAGLGVVVLSAFDFALRLGIPYWEVVPAALAVAVSHALIWNTLHPDTHYLVCEDGEKMSDSNGAAFNADFPLRGTAIWNWLLLNHTGHHTIVGNYNCVFPGADNIYGTMYTHKETAAGVPSRR